MKSENIKQLEKLINYHSWRYHTLDDPEIPDTAYDDLLHRYVKLCKKNNIQPKSETVVGYTTLDTLQKHSHDEQQWSFDNIYNYTELTEWWKKTQKLTEQNITTVCEQKIDGLKIVLHYEQGLLIRAVTRGDGSVGENVLHTVQTISEIPTHIDYTEPLRVIGEIWMSKKDLKSINEHRLTMGLPAYANARNLAAGTLRQLDAHVAAERNLHSFIYDISFCEKYFEHHSDELSWLKTMGFAVNPYYHVADSVESVEKYYHKQIDTRNSLAFDIDGIVIKVNSKKQNTEMGYTAKSPRFAVAYKFPANYTTSIVRSIDIQIGRSGILTPVANIEPVTLYGVMISRATLHNQSEINRLDLRVGDSVVIERAGDVIPKILSVIPELRPKKSKRFSLPELAKQKGIQTFEKTDIISGITMYYASSSAETNAEILLRQCEYIVSRPVFGITGLGSETLRKLIAHSSIQKITDIFTLSESDFTGQAGFAELSIQNTLDAIQKARHQPLFKVIMAIGIPGIGAETARLIAQKYRNPEQLPDISYDDLYSIHGIGDTIARGYCKWFSDPEHRLLWKKLSEQIALLDDIKQLDQNLSGQTWVVTGVLSTLSREQAERLIRDNGGKVSSSVSSHTDYVLVGSNAGSKLTQAKKLGIAVVDETYLISVVQ